MDANVNHNSLFFRMSEQALRVFAMGLVLTGQMLPAGAVSAQDDPPSPSFASPPAKPKSGLTPVAVESPPKEEEAAAPQSGEAAEEALPPASEDATPAEETPAADGAPVEVPLADEAPAAEPTPAAEEAPTPAESHPETLAAPETPAAEAAPAPNVTTEEAPASKMPAEKASESAPAAAAVESADPNKYQIGEWTMMILPGPVPPKVIREYHAPTTCEAAPMNQNNISVPVNVTVNNTGSQGWPWASPWDTPWANLNYWNSPTAAYLFQHPQPYWQLRQDFYHLKPFIRGL